MVVVEELDHQEAGEVLKTTVEEAVVRSIPEAEAEEHLPWWWRGLPKCETAQMNSMASSRRASERAHTCYPATNPE